MEQILEYTYLQQRKNVFLPTYKKYIKKRKKAVTRKQIKKLHKLVTTKVYLNNSRDWYFGKKKFLYKIDKSYENQTVPTTSSTYLLKSITKC